jgi:hypothetical protein
MASSASESAADRLVAHVGSEPVREVLAEAGITPTAAGVERWRAALRRPIPADALAEGQRLLREARAEAHRDAHGEAA